MNKKSEKNSQTIVDNEVIKLFKYSQLRHLVIIILFRGNKLPKYCIRMPRNPNPKINIPLDNNLVKIYSSAIKKNLPVEDGAILIQIDRVPPILRGFSYRIYPPPLNVLRLTNMGSGYNSSLDFSGVEKVVCVYYIYKDGVKKFINGEEKLLCSMIDKTLNKKYS